MTPLRMKMLDALMLRGMAGRTQEAYIDAVARLARHYGRGPERLSAEEVQQYLLHLLRERHLARSSVNQYGCAYRFLYGTVLGLDGQAFQIPLAPAPQRLPEILSREELARLFAAACHPKSRTFLMVAYGSPPDQTEWTNGARRPPIRDRAVSVAVRLSPMSMDRTGFVDGVLVNGVDIIKWNDGGQIVEFKVMLRPLRAINVFHQRMAAMLQSTQPAP